MAFKRCVPLQQQALLLPGNDVPEHVPNIGVHAQVGDRTRRLAVEGSQPRSQVLVERRSHGGGATGGAALMGLGPGSQLQVSEILGRGCDPSGRLARSRSALHCHASNISCPICLAAQAELHSVSHPTEALRRSLCPRRYASLLNTAAGLTSVLEDSRPLLMVGAGARGIAPLRAALEWPPVQVGKRTWPEDTSAASCVGGSLAWGKCAFKACCCIWMPTPPPPPKVILSICAHRRQPRSGQLRCSMRRPPCQLRHMCQTGTTGAPTGCASRSAGRTEIGPSIRKACARRREKLVAFEVASPQQCAQAHSACTTCLSRLKRRSE